MHTYPELAQLEDQIYTLEQQPNLSQEYETAKAEYLSFIRETYSQQGELNTLITNTKRQLENTTGIINSFLSQIDSNKSFILEVKERSSQNSASANFHQDESLHYRSRYALMLIQTKKQPQIDLDPEVQRRQQENQRHRAEIKRNEIRHCKLRHRLGASRVCLNLLQNEPQINREENNIVRNNR